MGAPGHRDAELGAEAHAGSGSEQPHALAQSKIQGFREASGCGLTRKHLPTQEELSERDGPGPAAPQPGDRGITSWKAKFLLLWGNRAVSTQHCEDGAGDQVWLDPKDGVPITQSRTQVGPRCRETHRTWNHIFLPPGCRGKKRFLSNVNPSHTRVVLVYTNDSLRRGLLPSPPHHNQLCRAGGRWLSKLLLSKGG